MTTLIRPDNLQPAEYVATERGYVCLKTSCITPAVRWYSLAVIETANPAYTCALPPFWTEYLYTCAEPPALVVTLTPALAANVNASAGVVIKIAPPVTLWHESMKVAA